MISSASAGSIVPAASDAVGYGMLPKSAVLSAQKFFGPKNVRPDEKLTFWKLFRGECSNSFFYIFQVSSNLIWYLMCGIFT